MKLYMPNMKFPIGTLVVGSKVWVVQKTKKTAGVITKMNIKKALVDMNGMTYRVPFSMLELI